MINLKCDPVSYYPDKVDEMTFFQDNSLENIDVLDQYNTLIKQGRYSEADEYINQQEDIYGFFADFFNLIENRIYTTQEYLLQKPSKKQPFIYYDEKGYPPLNITIFSDVNAIEPLDEIKLFNSERDYDIVNLKHLHIFMNDEELEKEEMEPINLNKDIIWI